MKFPSLSPRLWIALFAVYACILSAIIVVKLPPFTAADELNHFRRANMLLFGEVVGKRLPFGPKVIAGGTCERNLIVAWKCFEKVPAHVNVKPSPGDWSRAGALHWGSGTLPAAFENTAIYPPTYYVPQALAIEAGKTADLTILSTLTLTRIANAICCILLGAAALAVARGSRPYLFTLLLLPMTVDLMATATQDGLLIATAALIGALLARALSEDRPLTGRETAVLTVCFILVGMAKAPYGLATFLLLLVRTEKPQWRTAAIVVSLGAIAAWTGFDTAFVQTPMQRTDAIVDAHGQTLFVLAHPLALFAATARTLFHHAVGFGVQMIASLGSLDTPMPRVYFVLAIAVIASSIWLSVRRNGAADAKRSWIALAILAVSAFGVFGALYITFTSVGFPEVEGVQGRYFLPLAAMLPVIFARKRKNDGENSLVARIAVAAVLAFPIVSAIVIERALVARYY